MAAKLKVLDLFSGVGGFSLGLERTGGFQTVSFCELKPHSQAVLAKNFPGVRCHDDVTTYEFKEGEADVVTGGFPCQDISYAGAGAGLAGERSGLYREIIRAVRVVRPLIALLENVAALLSRGMGTVLGDLAEIGYDAEWHCIPASAVGAPHRRDRVWIVAHARGEQHEGDRPPISGTIAAELSAAFARNTGAPSWDDGETFPQRSDADRLGPYYAKVNEFGGLELRDEQVCQSRSMGIDVENAECFGCPQMEQSIPGGEIGEGATNPFEHAGQPSGRGWWSVEPRLGRVADGVPNRVDRLEEMGNAVVPQIPEVLGRAILKHWRAS